MMQQNTYPADTIIIEEGSYGDNAYIIDSGLVEISVNHAGSKLILAILSDGDLFGEMALIHADLRSATARTLRPTTITSINYQYFQDKIAQADPLVSMLIQVLLDRFHEARNKLLSLPPRYVKEIDIAKSSAVKANYEKERSNALERLKFIEELQAALGKGQFELYYQHVVSIEDSKTVGFEALLRWFHPERGLILPDDFIALTEETKDIIPIGYWVFETACKAWKAMAETLSPLDGSELPWVSVNVSPVQLADKHLIDRFAEILSRTGTPPEAIKIELTESALVDSQDVPLLFLHDIKRLGMRVSIDDFGTGYSSLSYLHLFPVDEIKIDHSFISTLLSNSRTLEVVQALIMMATKLKIAVVAEGVEKIEEATILSCFGCQFAQGFLYTKPAPVANVMAWAARVPKLKT